MAIATRDSLNRAIDRTKTEASRRLRTDYSIKKKDLDKAFRIFKATVNTQTAELKAQGYPLPVYDFSPRPSDVIRPQPGRGVSVSVKKGKRALLEGTFIARMKSGHIGVFARRKTKMMRSKNKKAIKERFAPSVPGMLSFDEMNKAIRAAAMNYFEIAMDQNVRRFGSRHG